TGQREGHESAIKINHQTRTGASRARLAPYPADRDHAGTITAMTAASPRATATVPLPPPVARPQDAPLRQDVRWLAGTLGRVVGRLAGEDVLHAVEELRRACVAAPRRGPRAGGGGGGGAAGARGGAGAAAPRQGGGGRGGGGAAGAPGGGGGRPPRGGGRGGDPPMAPTENPHTRTPFMF